MPYKDIEKRREAYRRWAKRNVEKRKNYQRILTIAKKSNPTPQPCSVNSCDGIGERHHPDYSKPKEIIWLCRSHHKRMEHSGECSICGGKNFARGFCNKHYKSERKKIDPVYKENTRLSNIRSAKKFREK